METKKEEHPVLHDRPKSQSGAVFSTTQAAAVGDLLGYRTYHTVSFTEDQMEALARFYGFYKRYPPNVLLAAGDNRNLFRQVETDGLRVMALIGHAVASALEEQ